MTSSQNEPSSPPEAERLRSLQDALEVPSIFANQVNVAVSGDGVRLSFAEQIPGIALRFRTSVTIPVHTAQGMINVLKDLIEKEGEQSNIGASRVGGQ